MSKLNREGIFLLVILQGELIVAAEFIQVTGQDDSFWHWDFSGDSTELWMQTTSGRDVTEVLHQCRSIWGWHHEARPWGQSPGEHMWLGMGNQQPM